MTPERMKELGEQSTELKRTGELPFTRDDLRVHIEALHLVINYLKGRGDCQLVCVPLNHEMMRLQDALDFRKRNFD